MIVIKLVVAAILITASVAADKRCHGIYFNDKYYNINIIKEGVNKIGNLILNRNDNILYFTFERIAKFPTRLVGYMNMETKETKVIETILNATSIAVDQKSNRVYVGSRNGLYKINEFKQSENLPIQDEIINVFYKDVLYYVNSEGKTYIFEDGYGMPNRELNNEKLEQMIIDNDNNVLFVNNNTLFRLKLGTRAVNIHEKVHVDFITTDIYNRAYICSSNGIYMYNKYKFALDKVANMKDLNGMTFNSANEPVYSVKDLIIKLSEAPIPCFED
ncbi:ommochrome-binding protein-like [Battus philenor]|uniref:ommochrome-binding protein-like n=1 Tax=Battus philenor TaxID=42288 RepID=UPI0035D0858F